MRRLKALLKSDAKSITRDPVLIMSIVSPILIAVFLRFGLPLITGLLMESIGFDLSIHYGFILSFMIMIVSFMIGLMSGFMILDERDEGILTYYTVTPLSKSGYFLYRLSTPVILCIIMSIVIAYFSNIEDIGVIKLIIIVIVSSIEAPIVALFLGVFASNKVEGLAIGKALGIMFVAPVLGYLVKSNWIFVAGILPTYWTPMAFISAVNNHNSFWIYIICGILVHGIYACMLLRKFEKKAF